MIDTTHQRDRSLSSPSPQPTRIGAGWKDLTALVSGAGVTVLLMFLLWEVVEQVFATSDAVAHLMHYARGISSSLVTAAVIGLISFRQHLRRSERLEQEVQQRTKESRQARRLMELIVDTTPASLLVLDRNMNIVQANRTAEEVHGETLTGRHCYEALAGNPEKCADCPATVSLHAGQPSKSLAEHCDPRTGAILEVESHPLDTVDGEGHVLLVERVVTEQKKLEARLLHQEKMAAFGLLAAEVAHDMGNPLSSIDAQLQLLDEESLPVDAESVVTTVRQEVRRLHRTLREIVDFARRRRDEATLVSVQSVVEDAIRLLRHDRRMRVVRLVEEFDPEAPAVFVVEDHLMQVVLNLLINAVDAMPGGGTLRIEIKPAGNFVALRIRDTGVGMEHDVLGRCFEPLFTTKDKGKGTGLGLSIARDILEAAGGRIELHSAPGRGTIAVVTLPSGTSSAEPLPDASSAATVQMPQKAR